MHLVLSKNCKALQNHTQREMSDRGYEGEKSILYTFKRVRGTLSFLSPHPRHTLQADFLDFSSIADANDGNRFILTTVDVFTGEASS